MAGTFIPFINPIVKQAINEIFSTYGDVVSVEEKKKSLNKFGFTDDVQTTSTLIARLPSAIYNETEIFRNLIDTVSSDNTNDLSTIKVEGHTVGNDLSASSVTQAAGIATYTTAAPHGYEIGDVIYIEGANETEYNGLIIVLTVPLTTTFTYDIDPTAATPATGTITATNQKKTFVVQSKALNGQTKIVLDTPLCKASRISVPVQSRPTSLVGSVYVYEDTAITAGVPTDSTKVHLMNGINGSINNSLKAATSLSSQDYWIITGFHAHYETKQNGYVDVSFQYKPSGGVWLQIDDLTVSAGDSLGTIKFEPFIIIPKDADVRLVGKADANGREAGGSIQGYLAIVTS